MQQFNASTRVDVHSSFTIVSSMSMLHVAQSRYIVSARKHLQTLLHFTVDAWGRLGIFDSRTSPLQSHSLEPTFNFKATPLPS